MTVFRLMVAGEIKKVEVKNAGGKQLAEVSVCKKNRTKEGDEETYTWVRLTVWGPLPDWMLAKLTKGNFIAGTGEFTLRSYEKDGVKRQSAECNCQSFDVEVSDVAIRAAVANASDAPPQPTQRSEPKIHDHMSKPAQGGSRNWEAGNDSPPFAPLGEWE